MNSLFLAGTILKWNSGVKEIARAQFIGQPHLFKNSSKLAGSDQATRLILKAYHYKTRCFQALNLHFYAPKYLSKASRHIRLKN